MAARVPIKIDGECYRSPARIATDNIPYNSNDPAKSITTIWAYLLENSQPIAWLYKSASGRFALQANSQQAGVVRSALKSMSYPHLFDQEPGGGNMTVVAVREADVSRINQLLNAAGATPTECYV